MKTINISEDIFPLAHFKTQASKVLKHMKSSGRPIVITQNGVPAAVMLTPEEFDLMSESMRFIQSVKNGLNDIESGDIITDDELTLQIDKRYGGEEDSL